MLHRHRDQKSWEYQKFLLFKLLSQFFILPAGILNIIVICHGSFSIPMRTRALYSFSLTGCQKCLGWVRNKLCGAGWLIAKIQECSTQLILEIVKNLYHVYALHARVLS